ncbi:hypothetical protein D9613_007350 [Agrocybe pediades]|uniref:Uncharacterized protein n=1 Tax=Agrocybe pediades TaxID=84607 RepID=A0A8H4VHP9_9AGAR|nr:hypothetical protein D9613_007350 [Agrocybe pediades]KAF9552693.1 hypothetical protein CPC08DRAFT_768121 [Agrocybe pediades]
MADVIQALLRGLKELQILRYTRVAATTIVFYDYGELGVPQFTVRLGLTYMSQW